MKIYLAGAIHMCSDAEATDWRELMKGCLPRHEILDPMSRDYRGIEDGNEREIVLNDLADIDRADVMVVYAAFASWGTAMEFFYMANVRKKPVILIHATIQPLSPWQKYFAAAVVDSEEEAARAIESLA